MCTVQRNRLRKRLRNPDSRSVSDDCFSEGPASRDQRRSPASPFSPCWAPAVSTRAPTERVTTTDRHRDLAAADRRLLRARQGRAARLRGLGEVRQRQRRPARPRRRAEDPRRPVQRRPGRRRLREADQQDKVDLVFGPFSTRLVVPAAQVAEDYGMLFVEPAGAAKEVFDAGLRQPLLRRARGRRRPLQPTWPRTSSPCRPDQRPEDGGLRRAWTTRSRRARRTGSRQARGRPGSRPSSTRSTRRTPPTSAASRRKIADSKADMVVGGSQYQDGVNLIVALQQLNYQPKLAAFSTAPTNAEFAEAIGDKTEGILSPTGYTPDATYPEQQGVRRELHRAVTASRRPRTRPTPTPPVRWSRPRSRRPAAPTRPRVPAEADRLAARATRSTPSSAR